MQLFSMKEVIENYNMASVKKCKKSVINILFMAMVAGLIIGLAGLSASLASFTIENYSIRRLVNGLIFPFGLGIIMLLESQLFTGNCMMAVSLIQRKIKLKMLLRNWLLVYIGNFAGAFFVGFITYYLNIYQKELFGIYLLNISIDKCQNQFLQLFVMGVLGNILVCTGVLLSMSAKDTVGRIYGAYIPVSLFIISGFEHCIANMFYVPAALFCIKDQSIVEKAMAEGINISTLSWESFFVRNLIPVTLGNIIGGMLIGLLIWNYSREES